MEDGTAKLQETFSPEVIFRVRPAAPTSTRLTAVKQLKVSQASCVSALTWVTPRTWHYTLLPLQPGHTVDLLDEDCWWIGIVKEVLATRVKILLTGGLPLVSRVLLLRSPCFPNNSLVACSPPCLC